MKGLTTLIAGGVSMLGVLAADARAYDPEGGYYKKCNESYGRVSGFWTTKPTGCKLARRVLDKWMANDGLSIVHLRLGRDGVLWTCRGYRPYGKLNPWWVSCNSSQDDRKQAYWQYRNG